jgi:hypothetical protein
VRRPHGFDRESIINPDGGDTPAKEEILLSGRRLAKRRTV